MHKGKVKLIADSGAIKYTVGNYQLRMKMTDKISQDIQASLNREPDQIVRVQGETPDQIFFVVTDKTFRRLTDESIREKIKIGLADEAAGRVSEFDANDIKERGRIRLQQSEQRLSLGAINSEQKV